MALRLAVVLALAAAIIWGGLRVWRDPRVQELVQESPRPQGDPLAFLKEVRTLTTTTLVSRAPRRPVPTAPASAAGAEEVEPEPEVISNIPDDQLSRLVLQRLFAMDKHDGISVSVRKSVVYLFGTAAGPEDRKLIIETVKKLPGVYKVDASSLEPKPQ